MLMPNIVYGYIMCRMHLNGVIIIYKYRHGKVGEYTHPRFDVRIRHLATTGFIIMREFFWYCYFDI